MHDNPLVSVIMPCYNMEKFIASSIESVILQTYPHWELVIVDDASTDETAAIVKKYCTQDKRIAFFEKEKNSGIADTRNLSIQLAKGRFFAFLDADDVWHSEKLEYQLGFMIKHNIGFTYTTYDWINEEGNSLHKKIPTAGDLNYHDYLKNTIIGSSTVMLDQGIVGEVIVPNFRTSEDAATWLNILRKGYKAYSIDKALASYRVRKKSASSNKVKAAIDLWSVYRKQEKLSLFSAFGYFCSYAFHAVKKRLV
ncbi:MAG: glycosyltransferase family 2 protein [Candidatus Limimorpha sp.]